jgi:ferredoxin-NADP reductase
MRLEALELVIARVRDLTPRVRAFELRHPAGAALPAFDAGAHLQVPVRLRCGQCVMRHYSISSDPARRDIYEIAILRQESEASGSHAAHEQLVTGLRLRCSPPKNHFALHADARPAVLLAGGVGITPLKAMAHSLQARGVAMQLHYASRNAGNLAFLHELRAAFGVQLVTYSSSDGERMNVDQLVTTAPVDAMFYVCGPGRLIEAVVRAGQRRQIDPARIRFERFVAATPVESNALELELRRTGMRLVVPAHQTLLDAMLESGIDAPFGCLAGQCGTCAVRVLAGQPDHRDSILSAAEREIEGLMCPCVSRATSELLVIDA